MKVTVFSCIVGILLLALGIAADSLTDIAAQLPSCGLQCTVIGIQMSGCGLNATCMCGSSILTANVTACLQEECTVREALTSAKVFAGGCGRPIRDIGMGLIFAPMPLAVLAGVAVSLRVFARTRNGMRDVGMDDWVIIVAFVFAIPFNVLGIALKNLGFGKDLWEIPFDDITRIFRMFYVDEQFYFVVLTLSKISILLFYLRVFPDRKFRRIVHVAIGINIAWGIVANAITIFQCWPIEHYWDRWDGTLPGRCNSASIQAWVTALFNIVLDLIIMALPFPQLFKLQLSWKRKCHILIMFAVGLFVTIISAVRLQALEEFSTSTNPTYDNVPAAYWSAIEANTSIICACLPACRSLLSKFFKKALEYTNVSLRSRNATFAESNGTKPNSGSRKAPRLSTLAFKGTGVQGTFVELNNYPSDSDTIHKSDAQERVRDTTSDLGSDSQTLHPTVTTSEQTREHEWADEKKQPTTVAHAV